MRHGALLKSKLIRSQFIFVEVMNGFEKTMASLLFIGWFFNNITAIKPDLVYYVLFKKLNNISKKADL